MGTCARLTTKMLSGITHFGPGVNLTRLIALLVRRFLTGVAIAVLIGVVPPAHADERTDEVFLAALSDAAIEFSTPQEAIAAGKAVCGSIEAGNTQNQTVRGVKNANPYLSMTKAAQFVAIARAVYCSSPDNGDRGAR